MRVRKRLTLILLVLALLLILIAVSVRMLLVSEPGWYQPVVIDAETQAIGQKQVQDEIADLRNRVGKAQVQSRTQTVWPTFDVEFTETQINGMISRWRDWPPLGRVLGRLKEPHIRFLNDRIVIAGRQGEGGPLISIDLTVTQTPNGPQVELGRPWAGRLPLSRSLLERLGGDIDNRVRQSTVPAETTDSLMRLLTGESFSPIVALPSNVVGQREFLPARVEKLTIEGGTLKATLRPFDPNQQQGRK